MRNYAYIKEESSMTNKKRLLLLTTGGTIASLPGGKGLEPQRSDVMERSWNSTGPITILRSGM